MMAMHDRKYLAVKYFCMSDQERAVVREKFGDTLVSEMEEIISQLPLVKTIDRSALAILLEQEMSGIRDFRSYGIEIQEFWRDTLSGITTHGAECPQELKLCLEKYVH